MIHKHKILKNFLHIIGVDMATAVEDACSMEHVLDVTTIKKLKKFAESTEIWQIQMNYYIHLNIMRKWEITNIKTI
ncbi:iron dependent repressor, metal binding and dimerization domain protein [Methanobacterium spitsbergense]|uniref:iron dependent repressor, metal binding and dimerization domain protein n=1 Tax=Methanobacterium spitsbergense TaxID=2874285 RepID=UPI001CBE23F2